MSFTVSSQPLNKLLAWSMGNGGKGYIRIEFPFNLAWYYEQPCTKFRSFQHRKEPKGLRHEFIVLRMTDGSICRVERTGDPNARMHALSSQGSVAYDIAQLFRPDDLAKASIDTSSIVSEVHLPSDLDLKDVLNICRAIQEDGRTRKYTLETFNCYFFSLALASCLTRLVADWENEIPYESWKSAARVTSDSVPSIDPRTHPLFRIHSMLYPWSTQQFLENIQQHFCEGISSLSWKNVVNGVFCYSTASCKADNPPHIWPFHRPINDTGMDPNAQLVYFFFSVIMVLYPTYIDAELARIALASEPSGNIEKEQLVALLERLRSINTRTVVWEEHPWAPVLGVIERRPPSDLPLGEEPAVITVFLEGQGISNTTISAFQQHILRRIEIQAKLIERVGLASAIKVSSEIRLRLSLVWAAIRNDDFDASGSAANNTSDIVDSGSSISINIPKEFVVDRPDSTANFLPQHPAPARFPRPLLDITAIGNTSPYAGYHHLLDPIPDVWYPSSLVKDAGWLYSPMYYVDQGNDGIQHVFCWSLSEYEGSGLNFIWRVCWSLHSELILALCQRFQEESYRDPFKLNGYVFDASSPDRRAMWREINPVNIFSPSLAGVALYPSIQSDWFSSSTLGSTISLPPESSIPAPSDYSYRSTDNLVQGLSSLYVNPVDTSLSPDPDPSSQTSDTSSDISVDPCSEDFEAEPVQGSNAYFCKDTRGNITLNVPRTLKDRDAVDSFLEQALAQLDKRVRHIKCSLCKNKKADRDWGVKPSNLQVSKKSSTSGPIGAHQIVQRHILAHLGIKGTFSPNECWVFVLMLR
ncbi:Putative phospholipid-transporting ATPase C24B11,12c [Schizosaccharomyces pombe 972h-] [Rhizoctonia solani]|uniref:Putative phospholipid-transporting ATPase C24B11,12c [Schizosaccharomyces pombe 972h-] n=1 Tax=Rhizoctonia solani TaxID=456999 RepID=A0A0K6GB25_9AGAM|nr:Putative phospholipid-transporting ATPase C24B11,12c [Schizosaccharomyces pombe 972h-] [Rhizoctonia solani]